MAAAIVAAFVLSGAGGPGLAAPPSGEAWSAALRDSVESLLDARRVDEAVTLAGQLVDGLQAAGVEDAERIRALELHARALRRSRQYRAPGALAAAEAAVAACAGPPAADPDLEAACRNTLGLLHYRRTDYALALPEFERAVQLWTDAGHGDDQKVAAALNNQGLALEALGRDAEAGAALERAIAIYALRRDEPEYRVKLAQTTLVLARLHLKLGAFDLAREQGEQAVDLYRSVPADARDGLGSALADLAAMHRTLGDLDRAEALYEEAIPLIEAVRGAQHAEVGRVLNNLGNLRADRGDIASARDCFERALVITEAAQGPDAPQTGLRLLNLGSIMSDLGDLDAASACLDRAERILAASVGSDHLYLGYTAQGMGAVLAARGEPQAALERFRSAQAIFAAKLGPDHPVVAEVLAQQAQALLDLGQDDEAVPLAARSRTIVRASLGADHPEMARVLGIEGRIELAAGHPDTAAVRFRQAVAIGCAALGEDHPDLAGLHLDLARALAALGHGTEAVDHALRAERIGRRSAVLAAAAFEERRALSYASRRARGLDLAVSLALEGPGLPASSELAARLWDELVRSRSLVQDLMGRRLHHSPATDSALADSLGLATRHLANLFVRGLGEDTPADYRDALAAAQARCDRLERSLAMGNLAFAREQARRGAGLREVIADLPDDATLVAYVLAAPGDGRPDRCGAFIVPPSPRAPQLVDLGRADRIALATDRWRRTIAAGIEAAGDELPALTDSCLAAGRALAALAWDPLGLDAVGGTVFVVADGALALVDLQTLPRAGGGFVIDDAAAVVAVSAERDLLARAASRPGAARLLVAGGMDYGPTDRAFDPAPRTWADVTFSPLPATGYEAHTIADLWRRTGGAPVDLLEGAAADEAAFKARAGGAAMIHLATHGVLLAGAADSTNPLLLAGVAFSGANLGAPAGGAGEDGILTAYEAAGLDLSGARAVVLSACDTGQGRRVDREGIVGLQRGFARAGLPAVVLSLAAVDDAVAAAWMDAFYHEHLDQGRPVPLAAREASCAASGTGRPWSR
ncbi:MAG TPA: CHAT domain-containing tetratricopeptide repeat protein, partial [Candidatus Krumholzibacteria bacterium]|nr:CHAT domain-containing tetratricopeptide repeat protein [Candidatus Krumholzibacteria bacterium]